MLICASRRTDIPAFHSEWMMNRLRAGYALVRNPVHRSTVYRVSLRREDVDCILFISKDPRPMVPHLKEIGSMGHMYLFQVTLNPYGKDLEPGVGNKADINDACVEISERIGRDRMSWRYDPVIINHRLDLRYHARKFDMLCREASRWTDRCVFSFVDVYAKISPLFSQGVLSTVCREDREAFMDMAVRTAGEYGIRLDMCCAGNKPPYPGIGTQGCFDSGLLKSLDIPYDRGDQTVLREGCTCVHSIDIGEYDTCAHGCLYCYANRMDPTARSRKIYDPTSETLWSAVMPRDRVVDLAGRSTARITDYSETRRRA